MRSDPPMTLKRLVAILNIQRIYLTRHQQRRLFSAPDNLSHHNRSSQHHHQKQQVRRKKGKPQSRVVEVTPAQQRAAESAPSHANEQPDVPDWENELAEEQFGDDAPISQQSEFEQFDSIQDAPDIPFEDIQRAPHIEPPALDEQSYIDDDEDVYYPTEEIDYDALEK